MDLPPGVARRRIGGESRLATRGEAAYGEPTAEGWRAWDPGRSKLAAAIDRDLPVDWPEGARVLYLGAAAGTTVSHLADAALAVFAVEFAPKPARRLREVAAAREGVVPLLRDARRPEGYAHVVDADCDLLVQDVATADQADVALRNRRFLADDGRLILTVKARSEDVTAAPATVYDRVLDRLAEGYAVDATAELDPLHEDHLAVVASPK